MILQPNGSPARKKVVDLTPTPQMFSFLMTGDPMQLLSSHGMDIVCRTCKEPVLPQGAAPNDATWRVECSCTLYKCSSKAAKRKSIYRSVH